MQKIFSYVITFLLNLLVMQGTAQVVNNHYDSALAHTLHAHDYGMRQYMFVLLSNGNYTITNKSATR